MKNKQEESDLWSEERRFWESGCTCICGADEAGAGPLAGPVYAAAVILPPGRLIPGLNDSKKLTARQREILFDQICAEAQAYAVASVDEQTLDSIKGMERSSTMRRWTAVGPVRPIGAVFW